MQSAIVGAVAIFAKIFSYFWPEQSDGNKQRMEKPLQLVYNKDGKLYLNPEALKVLQSIEEPMVVVSVVGAARTGKSYLMNCLAGDKKGFSVNSAVQAHTKGIWMWCRSLPQRPNEVLLLLDTEGLGDPEKGDIHNDHSIYSLAILLSSVLIYNGQRTIDQQSLQDLHFVTELSKRIQIRSQHDDSDSWDFVRFFPEFVWVIRDMTLDLKIDGKPVTLNEYLEHSLKLKDSETSEQDKKYNELRRCIRNHFPSRCCFALPIPTYGKDINQLQELEDDYLYEDFIRKRNSLISYIHSHKRVKRVLGGQLVTGRRFVELTKTYMAMMVDGVRPCVEDSVAKLAEVENQAAVDEALKFYNDEMEKLSESDHLTMDKLIKYYDMKNREVFTIFHKRSMNDNIGEYMQQLEEKMSSTYKFLMDKIQKKSHKKCEAHLQKVVSSITANLTSGHYQNPGGFQELKKDLDKAIKEYEERTKNELEGNAVLTNFLKNQEHRIDHVKEIDRRLTEEEKRISDLKQKVSRMKQEMKQEMENKERERKAAEERRAMEIVEQMKKKFAENKMYIMEELEEAMKHMRSEMKKYKEEDRNEDAQRAQQMYENLKKQYENADKRSFIDYARDLYHYVKGGLKYILSRILSL